MFRCQTVDRLIQFKDFPKKCPVNIFSQSFLANFGSRVFFYYHLAAGGHDRHFADSLNIITVMCRTSCLTQKFVGPTKSTRTFVLFTDKRKRHKLGLLLSSQKLVVGCRRHSFQLIQMADRKLGLVGVYCALSIYSPNNRTKARYRVVNYNH